MLSTDTGLDFNHGGYYDNHMDDETFGQRIKRLREARGLGVRELARRAGIKSHASITNAEQGVGWTRIPGPDITRPLAAALGVTHEVLLGEADGRVLRELRAPYLTDEALLLRIGAEPVPDDDLDATTEEFAASALHGHGNLIPQNYDEMRPQRKPRQKKGQPVVFKLRISGDCMAPTVRDGEVVWFDTRLPREPVALVVAVRHDHEAHVKRLVWRDTERWLESEDGWAVPVDDSWRILAVGFSAQRRLL